MGLIHTQWIFRIPGDYREAGEGIRTWQEPVTGFC